MMLEDTTLPSDAQMPKKKDFAIIHAQNLHKTDLQLIMCLVFVIFSATCVATTLPVVLRHDRGADALNLLMLLLHLLSVSLWIRVKPRLSIFQRVHNLLFFLLIQFLTETLVLACTLCRRSHGVEVT